MKIPNQSGVYALKALDSKLIYIGSSKNLRIRKNLHFSSFNKRDRDRYCKIIELIKENENIIFEIIELCENHLEREQYWIDFYRQQDTFKLVNVFDADRSGSSITEEFRQKMSNIRKEKWKDRAYREATLKKIKETQFTPERLNKPVHRININTGEIITYLSAKIAAEENLMHNVSICTAARGNYVRKFKVKNYIFIYHELVLYKLDELLETHQELRAISSQAWETCKTYHEGSTTNQ